MAKKKLHERRDSLLEELVTSLKKEAQTKGFVLLTELNDMEKDWLIQKGYITSSYFPYTKSTALNVRWFKKSTTYRSGAAQLNIAIVGIRKDIVEMMR